MAGSFPIAAFIIVLLGIMAWPGLAQSGDAGPPDANPGDESQRSLATRFPWLKDRSSFRFVANLKKGMPKPRHRGAFPLGNGRVFGMLGLEGGPGAITNIRDLATTPEASLGTIGLEVGRQGKVLSPVHWTLASIRHAAIVENSLTYPGLKVHTIDTAPPGFPGLLRVIVFRNIGDKPLNGLTISAIVTAEEKEVTGTIHPLWFDADRNLVSSRSVVNPTKETHDDPQRFSAPIGTLAPRQQSILHLVVPIGKDSAKARGEAVKRFETHGVSLIAHSYSWWQAWISNKTALECPDVRVSDLLDRCYIHLGVSRIGRSGPFASLPDYRGITARDQFMVARALKRAGDETSGMDAADALYRAAASTRTIADRYSYLDVIAPPAPAQQPMEVTAEHPESALLPVLLHNLLYVEVEYRSLIWNRWEYFQSCIQPFLESEERRYWTGEEVVRWIGDAGDILTRNHPGAEFLIAAGRGRAPRLLETEIEAVLALQAIDYLFDRLDLVRAEPHRYARQSSQRRRSLEKKYRNRDPDVYAATVSPINGERHPSPFAPTALAPLWWGFTSRRRASSLDSLDRLIDYLVDPIEKPRKDQKPTRVTLRLAPHSSRVPAEALARLLYVLSDVDHPFADYALESVLAAASPSGGLATELDAATLLPIRVSAPAKNRLDVAVQAAVVDALLKHFAGTTSSSNDQSYFTPRPRGNWEWMTLSNLPIGRSRGRISVTERPGKTTYDLSFEGPGGAPIEIRFLLPSGRITGVTCNGKEASAVSAFNQNTYYGIAGRMNIGGDVAEDISIVIEHIKLTKEPTGFHCPTKNSTRWKNTATQSAKTVILASRIDDLRLTGSKRVRYVDLGLPMTPATLASTFYDLEAGTRRCNTLVFAKGVTVPDPTNMKSVEFWENPTLKNALERFEADGGVIERK